MRNVTDRQATVEQTFGEAKSGLGRPLLRNVSLYTVDMPQGFGQEGNR